MSIWRWLNWFSRMRRQKDHPCCALHMLNSTHQKVPSRTICTSIKNTICSCVPVSFPPVGYEKLIASAFREVFGAVCRVSWLSVLLLFRSAAITVAREQTRQSVTDMDHANPHTGLLRNHSLGWFKSQLSSRGL